MGWLVGWVSVGDSRFIFYCICRLGLIIKAPIMNLLVCYTVRGKENNFSKFSKIFKFKKIYFEVLIIPKDFSTICYGGLRLLFVNWGNANLV